MIDQARYEKRSLGKKEMRCLRRAIRRRSSEQLKCRVKGDRSLKKKCDRCYKLGVPSSEHQWPSKKVEVPSSEHEQPSKKVEVPSSEHERPSKKVEVPSSEHERPSKKVEVPSSEHQWPSKKVEVPS